MKPLAFGLGVLLCGALVAALPQSTSNVATSRADRREQTLAARISSPEQRAPVKQVNVAQLRHDAAELAQLEQTVQAEIREVERGAVPKALGENLKKIQKLSKRLRRELLL